MTIKYCITIYKQAGIIRWKEGINYGSIRINMKNYPSEYKNFSLSAPHKYPRKIEFVDDLPKTISGKIKRKELKMKEVGQRFAEAKKT
ncbi:MAG: hypothetical protein Q8N12_04035 [Thermodesulfovibrionales bacterium]|nr:hypothetical protein [Thermodesulfovibrionales bacterium]